MNKKRLVWVGVAVAVVWIALELGGRAASPWVQQRFVEAMEERFDSKLEVATLTVRVFPSFQANGTGFIFRHHGRTDVPPLFKIDSVSATAGWLDGLRMHVSDVRLEGLHIIVPRGRDDDDDDDEKDENDSNGKAEDPPGFEIDRIVADGARLDILSKHPEKAPMTFQLDELELFGAGPASPMRYVAKIQNPKPPGLVDAEGHFGPWNRDAPRRTPLDGEYTFENADLSHFNGIAGILSSVGDFDGVLERIAVQGTTDTPDFKVDSASQTVHLKTDYTAVVDGTSGDTYLEPVIATFRDTELVANGKVAEIPGRDGKSVILDVQVERGRIEDVLALAVPADKAPLEGDIRFSAKFDLPPGDPKVMERLMLDGRFGIDETTFSEGEIQQKVNKLSQRAQGDPEQAALGDVASDFQGNFRMRDGVVSMSDLTFQMAGASVFLEGDYGMGSKELDFKGTLRMDAKVSETVTGAKSFFLKIVDPFFKKKGGKGSQIPIKIGGTVDDPSFGLALGGAPKPSE